MAGLSGLPTEIVDIILNHLDKPRHHLALLALLNKAHYDSFSPLLYRDVILQSAKHSCQLLLLFRNNTNQAAGVQRLTFAREPPTIGLKASSCTAALVNALPNIKTLIIDSWRSRLGTWTSIQPLTLKSNPRRALDKVEELSISGITPDQPIWPNAIMSLPSLKILSFHMCRLAGEQEPTPLADCADLPALQCLSLSNFDIIPKTFRALVKARACDTIRIEEVLRSKYSEPGEYIGSPEGLFKDIQNSTAEHLIGVKTFVHTDSKDWGCDRLSFTDFSSLAYLEVGAHNLYGALNQIEKLNIAGRRAFLRALFPPSLQILCLDIPNRSNHWSNFREFLALLAEDKLAIAPNLHTVIYHRICAFYILDGVPDQITEACKAAGIEIMAAPFAKVYLDGRGRVVEVKDRMSAKE